MPSPPSSLRLPFRGAWNWQGANIEQQDKNCQNDQYQGSGQPEAAVVVLAEGRLCQSLHFRRYLQALGEGFVQRARLEAVNERAGIREGVKGLEFSLREATGGRASIQSALAEIRPSLAKSTGDP